MLRATSSTRRAAPIALLVSLLVLSVASRLEADSPTIGKDVGELYPDLVLPDLDGKLRRLSDFRGQKVFLFHFASW